MFVSAPGATFPIAAAWFANARRPIARRASGDGAADAGALYAANTAGAAIGALAAGFWLIPVLGVRSTTWAGILLNLAAAAGALMLARAEGRAGALAVPLETLLLNDIRIDDYSRSAAVEQEIVRTAADDHGLAKMTRAA